MVNANLTSFFSFFFFKGSTLYFYTGLFAAGKLGVFNPCQNPSFSHVRLQGTPFKEKNKRFCLSSLFPYHGLNVQNYKLIFRHSVVNYINNDFIKG